MNFYQPNSGFYNPYYNQQMQQPMNYNQPVQQPVQQPIQQPVPTYKSQQTILQGKSVDSIDVVKATDIPLDGSISYFPLADGTAIVTKQLQLDGTSKIIVYKPIEENEEKKAPKYVTTEEFNETIKKLNEDNFKDEIKTLKRNVEDITEDLKKIKNRKD